MNNTSASPSHARFRANSSFQGGAFWPSLSSGRIAGAITLTDDEASFSSEQGERSISLDSVQLRLGGANDRMLFLSDSNAPENTLFTADLSILEHPALADHAHLAEQVQAARNKRSFQRLAWVGVPVMVLLLLFGLWSARGWIVGVVVARIPADVEVRIGELAANQLIAPAKLHDPELDELLGELVAPLARVASDRYDYRFSILEDEAVNAFALPGGQVGLHSALILEADSTSEIHGVLAHEIAHAQERHTLRNLVSSAGLFLVVQTFLGDLSGLLAVVAEGGLKLTTLRFSRDFEREADDVGLLMLEQAGLDPWGLPLFLRKLQSQYEDTGGVVEVIDRSADFLSTHPSSAERIERLERQLRDTGIQPRTADSPQLEALQARLREVLDR